MPEFTVYSGKQLAEVLQSMLFHAVSEMSEAALLSPEDKTELYGVLLNVSKLMGGRLVDNYSGRCMRGAECIGIICDDVKEFAFALAQVCFEQNLNPAELREKLGEPAQDSMGKGFILYWPRFLITPSPRD